MCWTRDAAHVQHRSLLRQCAQGEAGDRFKRKHKNLEKLFLKVNTKLLIFTNFIDKSEIGRLNVCDQTWSKCAFEKVADHFQCFCMEWNRSDIVFYKSNG